MSPAETVRSQTCGRAALREVWASIRAMQDRAMDAARRLPVIGTRDERQPEWVRVYALRDALDTLDASEHAFRCFCPACSAEDAAGVGFGEPIEP